MIAGGRLTLEIVTPQGLRLREKVRSVTAPGSEGELGLLPGHRPLLAALNTGIVTYEADHGRERVAVGPGMIELFEDRVVLLTERFVRQQDVQPEQARLELGQADEALESFTGDPGSPEYLTLALRQLWAAVQLDLCGAPPPPVVRMVTEIEARPVEDYGRLADADSGAEGQQGAHAPD